MRTSVASPYLKNTLLEKITENTLIYNSNNDGKLGGCPATKADGFLFNHS